jgi:hypothetical protein
MTYDDFCDGLRFIYLHALTEDDYQAWADFKRDPLRWLLRADDHRAPAVWSAIERGRKGRPPATVENSASSDFKVINLFSRDNHDSW